MIRLDDRDIRLLAVLQADGRISKTALAGRINLSPAACWERLKRLEDAGVIEGYGARISAAAFGPFSTVILQAELASHRAGDFSRFEAAVRRIPEIVDCWAVGGGVDYVLRVVCRDIDAYQRLVDRMLDADVGLKRYYSYVVTKAVKGAPAVPLGALATQYTPCDAT